MQVSTSWLLPMQSGLGLGDASPPGTRPTRLQAQGRRLTGAKKERSDAALSLSTLCGLLLLPGKSGSAVGPGWGPGNLRGRDGDKDIPRRSSWAPAGRRRPQIGKRKREACCTVAMAGVGIEPSCPAR